MAGKSSGSRGEDCAGRGGEELCTCASPFSVTSCLSPWDNSGEWPFIGLSEPAHRGLGVVGIDVANIAASLPVSLGYSCESWNESSEACEFAISTGGGGDSFRGAGRRAARLSCCVSGITSGELALSVFCLLLAWHRCMQCRCSSHTLLFSTAPLGSSRILGRWKVFVTPLTHRTVTSATAVPDTMSATLLRALSAFFFPLRLLFTTLPPA